MNLFTPCSLTLFMAAILFLLGLGACVSGIAILIGRAGGREARALAAQTTRLAQKGLAVDSSQLAGLVGNANALLGTINEMARTAAGIGIFLSLLGLFIVAITFWLVYQTRSLCLI
jgi:hypothetical protein